jgi:hypothetical protein
MSDDDPVQGKKSFGWLKVLAAVVLVIVALVALVWLAGKLLPWAIALAVAYGLFLLVRRWLRSEPDEEISEPKLLEQEDPELDRLLEFDRDQELEQLKARAKREGEE